MSYKDMTIREAVLKIQENVYVLPAIQREFVWKPYQIRRLFDSLMQGYPIGSFLFWELRGDTKNDYKFYKFIEYYHERDNRHNEPIDLIGTERDILAVLDGQQRMTALYIGLLGTYAYKMPRKWWNSDDAFPVRKLYINLMKKSHEEDIEYIFEFLKPDQELITEEDYWFRVGDILTFQRESDVFDYYMDNIAFTNFSEEKKRVAANILSRLYEVINKDKSINFFLETSEILDKVLNIFIRVNSGGTVLSYSDLLLSTATAQWKKLDARAEITKFVDTINGFGGNGQGFRINKDFVLKASLVLADVSSIRFKVDNFNRDNMLKIEESWSDITKSLRNAYELASSFGYSGETLISNNSIIPIAYYLKRINNPSGFSMRDCFRECRELIRKYLIRTEIKRTYTNQPDSVLTEIRSIIQNSRNELFPFDDITNRLNRMNRFLTFQQEEIENLLDLKYGSKELLSVLMLLYPDFDFSQRYHIDHIYPRSKFKRRYLEKNNVPNEKIDQYIEHVNDLANLEILPAISNQEKTAMDFDKWFEKHCPTEGQKENFRNQNHLPSMQYTYDNFDKFLSKRRMLIKSVLENTLM